MIRPLVRALPLTLLAACAHVAPVATPYASDVCPLPPDATGYTVVARAADSTLADQPYLRLVVRGVVGHWDPSGKPWRPALDVATPRWDMPELFWRGEWRPSPEQHADVAVAIRRDGSWSAPRLAASGGDSAFDRGVLDAVRRALTAPTHVSVFRDSVPRALPAGAAAAGADSVVVHLLFGERPRDGERAVARFAVQEKPVAPSHSTPPAYPTDLLEMRREGSVVMQFVVDSTGRVDAATMRVLRTSDAAFTREVQRVLPRYTFRPAQLDCTAVSQLVQLPFTFAIETSAAHARSSSPLRGGHR